MILVTGATGVIGQQVVAELVAAGHPVRAVTRDPVKAKQLGLNAVLVQADLARPETLRSGLAGVDSVFMLTGGGPETPLHDANLGEAAAAAGVRHLVKLSIIGAEYQFDDLVSTWHLAGERAIQQIARRPGGPSWTIIRPGEFMSNARLWAPTIKAKDAVFWPHGQVEVAVIDPRDVAAVAVRALISPGHEGKTYRIGGPEALSTEQRVAVLAAALGRPLKLVDVPVAAASQAAAQAGRQALVVETTLNNLGLPAFQEQARKVLDTTEAILGRPSLTFQQWVLDNLALFR